MPEKIQQQVKMNYSFIRRILALIFIFCSILTFSIYVSVSKISHYVCHYVRFAISKKNSRSYLKIFGPAYLSGINGALCERDEGLELHFFFGIRNASIWRMNFNVYIFNKTLWNALNQAFQFEKNSFKKKLIEGKWGTIYGVWTPNSSSW